MLAELAADVDGALLPPDSDWMLSQRHHGFSRVPRSRYLWLRDRLHIVCGKA
jgi:hypothetical protein